METREGTCEHKKKSDRLICGFWQFMVYEYTFQHLHYLLPFISDLLSSFAVALSARKVVFDL